MNKYTRTALTISANVALALAPAVALGQGLTPLPSNPQGTIQGGNLVSAVIFLLNAVLIIAALAAVVFLIIGGFRYIFSQGESDQVDQAKNTILYSVVGLIVIGLAAVIVNFVVGAIASVDPTGPPPFI